MDNIYFLIIPAIILFPMIILMVHFHFKKKSVIKKINTLSLAEKDAILDQLAESVGYTYDASQDIFAARLDALQKHFGYATFYDLSAPYFNMIFDYETIYFDYEGKTWLIEMWKGQYGINTGCELGIYYADRILTPEQYTSTLFKVVEPGDMLNTSLSLNRYSDNIHRSFQRLGRMKYKHWWLTIFKMGTFSKPKDLFVSTSIRFKDSAMLNRFLESFRKILPFAKYKINGLTLYFVFGESNRRYSSYKKMVRKAALTACHFYCVWFQYLTRNYTNSGDKLLYLYYYLPTFFRHALKKIPGR